MNKEVQDLKKRCDQAAKESRDKEMKIRSLRKSLQDSYRANKTLEEKIHILVLGS